MDRASSKTYQWTPSSSISGKGLAFYGDSGKHMLSAVILNYENCSRIQNMYQVFSVYRVYWLSELIEKKLYQPSEPIMARLPD